MAPAASSPILCCCYCSNSLPLSNYLTRAENCVALPEQATHPRPLLLYPPDYFRLLCRPCPKSVAATVVPVPSWSVPLPGRPQSPPLIRTCAPFANRFDWGHSLLWSQTHQRRSANRSTRFSWCHHLLVSGSQSLRCWRSGTRTSWSWARGYRAPGVASDSRWAAILGWLAIGTRVWARSWNENCNVGQRGKRTRRKYERQIKRETTIT